LPASTVTIVDRFPYEVRQIEHVMVPGRDGVRLAARMWLPAGADAQPVPAILEYIPYRKRDGTRLRDEPMHHWFAGHGYAAVRVDLRGSGDSEGVLLDEYTATEQEDALCVLAWIAAQPWCDGRIAMLGKSWGGFGALQVAARQPPQLHAVIAVCASDDRYADDAHYMGGCLLNENLLWGSMLMTLCAQPPDPELAGNSWRRMWEQRLAAVQPFPALWLRHPTRDAYWRHGSICEDFGAVRVPVFAISGWADGYSNAVLRLLAGLSCPRWGMIGPWGHSYPHEGVPGPAIGFLQLALQFLDHCVRGRDNGWQREPLLRTWLQDSVRPVPEWHDRAGRWVVSRQWPDPHIQERTLRLGDGTLLPAGGSAPPVTSSPPAGPLACSSPLAVGLQAGSWCAFGLEGEQPGDQRDDDAGSLCFDSEPLAGPLAILGAPVVRVVIAADREEGLLCARLCEVFPDGASARVSFGLLNLAHRHGHDVLEPLPPGVMVAVEIRMNDVAHVFARGNRLRLALSTSYWPVVWPSARAVTLTVMPGGSLTLPERPPRPEDGQLPALPPPEQAPPPQFTDIHAGGVRKQTMRNEATGEIVQETVLDLEPGDRPSRIRYEDIALETGHGVRETFTIRLGEPLSARADIMHRTISRRGSHVTHVELRASMTADLAVFHFTAELVARHGSEVVAARRWAEAVPRRSV
jgi:uncharacterized protein